MSRYTPRKPQTLKREIKKLREEIESLQTTLENTNLSESVKKQLETLLKSKQERLNNLLKVFAEICSPD